MTTAILSALPEEQAGLSLLLSYSERLTHAGRGFVKGFILDKPIILALSGIGKVAAATTATALIEHFGVQRIVFTGVAGGVGDGVQVGDVVVGTGYVQHDMDCSPLFARFEIPGYGKAVFAADETLAATLTVAACAYSAAVAGQFTIHSGLIASADRFVADVATQRALCADLPGLLCVDMESAAVAQVCHDFQRPFVAIRTISDRADATAHTDFKHFVRSVAGPYAVGIVQEWMSKPSAGHESAALLPAIDGAALK